MNDKVQIRKALSGDAEALEIISCNTFIETFAAQNTKEDMDLFLTECFNLEAIRNELNDGNTEYHMAFVGNELAGYIKIRTASHSDFRDTKALEVARIYVYEKYQGQGVGASLMRFIIDHATANGSEIVWLGVWEHNPKAIRFYERWGFHVFSQHIFKLGNDDQNDFLMKKKIERRIFREATTEDIEQIQLVRNSVKENMLSDPALVSDKDCEEFINVRGKGWVCDVNGRIVGFSIADLKDNNIWALFVHPEFEKMGIGRKLQDVMLEWYFNQTQTTVWLGTAPGTRAEQFYRRSGWRETGLHGKGEIKFEITFEDWKKIIALKQE